MDCIGELVKNWDGRVFAIIRATTLLCKAHAMNAFIDKVLHLMGFNLLLLWVLVAKKDLHLLLFFLSCMSIAQKVMQTTPIQRQPSPWHFVSLIPFRSEAMQPNTITLSWIPRCHPDYPWPLIWVETLNYVLRSISRLQQATYMHLLFSNYL